MTRVYGSIVSTVRKKPSLTNTVISRFKEHYLDYLPHVSTPVWTKTSEDMTAITLSAFVEVRSPRSQQLQLVHLRQDRFGQAESKGW